MRNKGAVAFAEIVALDRHRFRDAAAATVAAGFFALTGKRVRALRFSDALA
jgi:hypothetical protein